jgi:multiple sugar transport system permease protein
VEAKTRQPSIPRGKVKQDARESGRARRANPELFWGLVCVAPAVLGFLLWRLVPIVASFLIALTHWDVAGSPEWAGLANFHRLLFEDPLFVKSLSVTALYAALSVPATMVFAFFLAVLLNQKVPGLRIFRTIFYLPSVMPVVASSVLWLWLFNPDLGLLNAALQWFGLPKLRWIYSEIGVIPSLVLMSLWSVGPMMIIFLAGLQDVPRQLYEAVEVDGGSAWHKLRHITIPMMTPTILFNLLISVIYALQTFTQAYVMTSGGPNNSSLFLVYYIYRKAFQESDMGYASALAWVLFIIVCALSFLLLRTSNRWVHYQIGET